MISECSPESSNLNRQETKVVTTVAEIVASPKSESVPSPQQQQQQQHQEQQQQKQQQHQVHEQQQQHQEQQHRHHHHKVQRQHKEHQHHKSETSDKNIAEETSHQVTNDEIVQKDFQENDNSKTSNGKEGCVNPSTDKSASEESPNPQIKDAKSFRETETQNISKSFQEVSTNCPSETSAVQTSSVETSSYETTYPVFTGQSEYGQESIHVEPFYRYRVYSESKV